MPINLPDLGQTHCKSMLACGIVETKSKNALRVLHGTRNHFVIEYERAGQAFRAFITFGGGHVDEPTNHFHVEIRHKVEDETFAPDWLACRR